MTYKVKKGDKRVCRCSDTLKTFIQHWQCVIKKLQKHCQKDCLLCILSDKTSMNEKGNYVKLMADSIKWFCFSKRGWENQGKMY